MAADIHACKAPRSLRRLLRIAGAAGGALGAALPSATALVRWNDSREQVFLNLSATASWESNIFASAGGEGDFMTGFNVGLDYQRRAGLIGVDAGMTLASGQFNKFSDENYLNPNLSVELTKDSGRTTGSLNMQAVRESRADSAANVRTESWNYGAGLNLKYPVIERYSLAGSFNYSLRDFKDNSVLVDLAAYAMSIDLFYVYTSERDLLGGYQLRQSESSSGLTFLDHAFTAGITGKIFPKVSGTVRGGYQFRDSRDPAPGLPSEDYSSWTLSTSATWTISGRINLTGRLSKDFSITSTDVNIDSLAGSLDLQMALNARTTLFAGVNFASSDFLGQAGAGRHDTMFGFSAGLNRTIATKIKASLNYSYSQNWSTEPLSDFDRQSVSLNLSTRL